VVDAAGRPLGWADTSNLQAPVQMSDLNLSGTIAPVDGTLRQLFDATLSAPIRRGVVVSTEGTFLGTVSLTDVVAALGDTQPALDRRVS